MAVIPRASMNTMAPFRRQHTSCQRGPSPDRTHMQRLLKRTATRQGRLNLVRAIQANKTCIDKVKARDALLDCLNKMDAADPYKIQDVFPRMDTAGLLRSLWKRIVPDRTKIECFSEVLGYGREGIVVSSRYRCGGPYDYTMCAVKVQHIKNAGKEAQFRASVAMHQTFQEKLARRTPRLFDSYLHKYGGSTWGVTVMQRVDAVVEQAIVNTKSPALLLYVAHELKELVKEMHAARLVHGDLHTGNVGFCIFGSRVQVVVIDFGRSFVDCSLANGFDEYWVWRASLFPSCQRLNKFLHNVDFPGSQHCYKLCDIYGMPSQIDKTDADTHYVMPEVDVVVLSEQMSCASATSISV